MFSVEGSVAAPLTPVGLAEAGLREREHLQEWVLANPDLLGEDVLIVTSEYDRWGGTGGVKAKDRLDILGLDSAGRLVVVELKRNAPSDTHLQAITYAALVSRFTLETLAEAHAAWLTRRGTPTDSDSARAHLLEHAGELDADLLHRPRVILIAGTFPRQVTHTAVWLSEMGVDMELMEVSAWRHGETILAGFNRLWPTPELEEFTLRPTQAAEQVSQKVEQRARHANAVRRLIDAGTLPEDTEFQVSPGHGASAYQRSQIQAWVAEHPNRGRVTWRNDPSAPLIWASDGSTWLPTQLARHILLKATGATVDGLRGTTWFADDEGRTLAELADAVPGGARRDWSDLHAVLDALPEGYWTTYGDLAQVVGTGAQALGQHIASCVECPNAHRVLTSSGQPSANFRWTDPDREDDPVDLLTVEGLTFTNGTADPARRLDPQRLALAAHAHA